MTEPTGLDYHAAYRAMFPGLAETIRIQDLPDDRLKTVDRAARLRRAERERVKALIAEIHIPFSIYTECDHDHDEDEPGVLQVEEVGLTCKDGLMYRICTVCCLSGGDYQPEHCADTHEHTKTGPVCPTAARLEEIR